MYPLEDLNQQNQSNEWEGLYFEKEKIYFVFLLSSDKRGTVMVGLLFLGHYKLGEKGNFLVNSKAATLLYTQKREQEKLSILKLGDFWDILHSNLKMLAIQF